MTLPWLVPDPWEREADEAQRQRKRARDRSYQREYRQRHRDELNAYKREWMRRHREALLRERDAIWQEAVGSLHSLGCAGGHRNNRRSCRPIPVYARSA